MAVHKLKCWPKYFRDIITGLKTFELRRNDRGFKVGDYLDLQEWDPKTEQYTGQSCRVEVTYCLELSDLNLGYVVMSIVIRHIPPKVERHG